MNKKVLIEALARPWFMEPQSAAYYASIVHRILCGENVQSFFDNEEIKEFAFVVNSAGKRIGGVEDAIDNGVAVINLKGAVMKYDYCGAPGTQSLMKALDAANSNPSVSGIVLQIDSPGGSVDGTQQFANAVKNSKKPVVAYVNGMMASAAMWIGSAASTRIASSNTDVIGSIGTMASWADYKGMYESKGVKVHEVYATDSTQKNIGMREAGNGNYEPLIKGTLDPLNNQFTAAIQSNIPGVDQTVLSGAHYIATDAKKKGLIDKIGTFEQAVKTAMQLGKEQQATKQHTMIAFENTIAASGSEGFDVVDGGFLLTEEQLQAIEHTLAGVAAAQASTEQKLTAALADMAEAALVNEGLTQTIEGLNAEIADLKKGPAAAAQQTTKDADDIGATGSQFNHPVNAEANRLRHMQGKEPISY